VKEGGALSQRGDEKDIDKRVFTDGLRGVQSQEYIDLQKLMGGGGGGGGVGGGGGGGGGGGSTCPQILKARS